MIDCRSVSAHVAAGGIDDLPLAMRIQIRLHLMMCRHCRRYAKQIRTLAAAVRSRAQEESSTEGARRRLADRIMKHAADSTDDEA